MYKLTKENTAVIRLSDNAYILFAEVNRDYTEYLEQLASGNMPQPAQTTEEIKKEKYDTWLTNRQSAYKTESDPLKIEAEFDAFKNNTDPDYTEWINKVNEIKARFPFPE